MSEYDLQESTTQDNLYANRIRNLRGDGIGGR